MEDAAGRIQRAAPSADVTVLEREFNQAEAEHTVATERFKRIKRVIEARESLPTNPVDEDADDEDEERSVDARVTRESLTYERGAPHSIFADIYAATRKSDLGAMQRLEAHKREMRVQRPKGARRAEQRDLSSTDAAGGFLVAPLHLQEEFLPLARAARPTANAIGVRPLPPNTDTLTIPGVDTGTATADQADNAAVQETDAAFREITVAVKTKAGMQDVSRQLLDRSVPGIDDIIFADLAADYNTKVDVHVLNNNVANSLGLLQVSGTNGVTYTDATPSVPELYPKLADGIQKIHTGRFLPPDLVAMHPRRWGWCLSALDTSNRPLITPYAPQNAMGLIERVGSESVVGSMQGLPVLVDSSVPITEGAGTEDKIIVFRTADQYLWEDPEGPYLETFPDVGSGTLTVRFRLHNYMAFCAARYPKSISVVSGSGLISPTF